MSELPDDTRALLSAAREDDEPTAADRARVRARVTAAIAVGAGVGATAGAATAKAAGVVVAKVGAATGSVASVGGTAAVTAGLGLATKIVLATVVAAGIGGGSWMTLRLRAEDGPSLRVPGPTLQGTAEPRDTGGLEPRSPAIEPVIEVVPPVAAPAEPVVAPAAAPAAKDPPARVRPTAPAPAASTLTDETTALGAIRAALAGGDGARALAALDGFARRFPKAHLAQEAAAFRIDALCLLGRTDEAQAAVDGFLAAFPDSPHAAKVRRGCAP